MLSISSRSWNRSNSFSLPASMAEMSSTSSTSASSERVDAWIVLRYSRCSGSSRVVASSSDMPDRPLSGVRNSWLMLARKRLLASLALRASSIAAVSARSSEPKYSGTAATPTSNPHDSIGLSFQYGVKRITTKNDASAITVAAYR